MNVSVSELVVMRMRACGQLTIILTLDSDNFASFCSAYARARYACLKAYFSPSSSYTDAAIAFNSLDCENLTLTSRWSVVGKY